MDHGDKIKLALKKIESFDKNPEKAEEALGYNIYKEVSDIKHGLLYSNIGADVLYMFHRYPEHAELLDEMLSAITGKTIFQFCDKLSEYEKEVEQEIGKHLKKQHD